MSNPHPTKPPGEALASELARLRRQEGYFDRAELAAHIGQYEWSYRYDCLLSCTAEYARIHDMGVDEVMRRHDSFARVLEGIHPDDRERFADSEKQLRENKAIDIEYRLLLASGETRYVRECSIEIDDESGMPIGTFGFLQDVSDMTRYKRDLEYRDELARQTEAITDIGHFIFDERAGCYEYLSSGCAREGLLITARPSVYHRH